MVQEISEWAVIEPLPSYGHGRDAAGGRYISLIFGTNLTDVVVTGKNIHQIPTIDTLELRKLSILHYPNVTSVTSMLMLI